ncbi:hypothetical protein B0T17DRAFT_90884 [Bombardia bombarda]|uniref:SRR1-like domain-containing protein n=1 Tax=Bombardia bombarda TaxID=252184 RepID=A0AA39XML2_9PEZI|nr:hypothetical protein B0T17DRAFT_90884 [Bombardia bombarda]
MTMATSSAYETLEVSILDTNPDIRIRRIVAFGCGALYSRFYFRHVVHTALITVVRKILVDHYTTVSPNDTVVHCCAQDPAYNMDNIRLLQEQKILVLDDPDGLLAVNEETLVIAINPGLPVRQIICDMSSRSKGPAMMIWARGDHMLDRPYNIHINNDTYPINKMRVP